MSENVAFKNLKPNHAMNIPMISVVMSVYNGRRFLAESIESVLRQTFHDFEFVIIDDGSTDETGKILEVYARSDDRIRVYSHANIGLTASLNKGCRVARGDLIARMDADDVSLPKRFDEQVRYLEAHREVGIVGTWAQNIDANGKMVGELRPPTTPGMITWLLFFGENHVIHPSVMMRREIVDQLDSYRRQFRYATDYDLWVRASRITQIAILPQILLKYRAWDANMTRSFAQDMERETDEIAYLAIKSVLGSVQFEAAESLRNIGSSHTTDIREIWDTADLIQTLYQACQDKKCSGFESTAIAHDVAKKLFLLGRRAGFTDWRQTASLFGKAARLYPGLVPNLLGLLARRLGPAVRRRFFS